MCGDLFPCTVDRVVSRWIENQGQYMSLSEMTGNDIKAYATTGAIRIDDDDELQAITSSFYRI